MIVRASIMKALCKAYKFRRKFVDAVISDKGTLSNLNWSGGSRSVYSFYELATGNITEPTRNLGAAAPWDNKDEGRVVPIPPGFVLVDSGISDGRPHLRIVVNQADTTALLTQT